MVREAARTIFLCNAYKLPGESKRPDLQRVRVTTVAEAFKLPLWDRSPRCASAIQIVRPFESTADTQPQIHPALLRLSAMISEYFTFWRQFILAAATNRDIAGMQADACDVRFCPTARLAIETIPKNAPVPLLCA